MAALAEPVVFARLQNGGLANRLFPWARAIVYSTRFDLRMLPVRWQQAKVGPFLRRETDLRLYLSQFRQDPMRVRVPERALWLRVPEVEEPKDLSSDPPSKRLILVFTGLKTYFSPILANEDLLSERLIAVTRSGRMPSADQCLPIVAHIRMSDFGAMATPLSWFTDHIEGLREDGIDLPVGIVSDGLDDELRPVTRLPGVSLVRTGTAIGDLHVAASAQVLFGSALSTFSAWAAFLGGQATTFCAGTDLAGMEQWSPDRVMPTTEPGSPKWLAACKTSLEVENSHHMRLLASAVTRR